MAELTGQHITIELLGQGMVEVPPDRAPAMVKRMIELAPLLGPEAVRRAAELQASLAPQPSAEVPPVVACGGSVAVAAELVLMIAPAPAYA